MWKDNKEESENLSLPAMLPRERNSSGIAAERAANTRRETPIEGASTNYRHDIELFVVVGEFKPNETGVVGCQQ
jgi:hypothetical protein